MGFTIRHKFKKVNVPTFNGEQPDDWVFRAERYFNIHHLTEKEKIVVSSISFLVKALWWFRWAEGRKPFINWHDLKARILTRFRPTQEVFRCAKFLAVRQESSFTEYKAEFESLSAPLPKLTEVVLEGTFKSSG